MKRKLPELATDQEAEAFVAGADLTACDLSGMTMIRFEFQPKEARANMRLPGELLAAVKARAARMGVPYQRFTRQALEAAIAPPRRDESS